MGKLKTLFQEYGPDCIGKTVRTRDMTSTFSTDVIYEDIVSLSIRTPLTVTGSVSTHLQEADCYETKNQALHRSGSR